MAAEDLILTKELLKRNLGNLGAIPGDRFGLVGITPNEFKIQKNISLQFENGETEHYPIWAGEIKIESTYKSVLTNIGSKNIPEFILLFVPEDSAPIGMRLVWDYVDHGAFMICEEQKWRSLSVLQKLQITTGLELITQEGIPWQPCPEIDDLYKCFAEFVDIA